MANKSKFTIIQQPNTLERMTNRSGGITATEAIRRGEETLAEMADDHKEALETKLFQLEAMAEGLQDTATLDEDSFARLFRNVYDLKGQGTTFGYPLISKFGASLLSYLEKSEQSRRVKAEIIKLHVETLRAVQDGDLSEANTKDIVKLTKRFDGMISTALNAE